MMGALISNKIVTVQWIVFLLSYEVAAQNCNFYYELVVGQEYNIYSPSSYPSSYNTETHCYWNLRTVAGSKVYLSCMVELPWSQNCIADRLLISPSGNRQFIDASNYCGTVSFSMNSVGTDISVALHAPYLTKGGRFLCTATAIKNSNPTAERQAQISSSCDCGWKQVNRIVGGTETGVHEFPYMAALIHNGKLLCGTSLISDRFSLTAGHCVLKKNVADMNLLVGDHNIATGDDTADSAIYKIDAYEIYPDYNPSTQKNDIALVHSATRILFSLSIGPVCLPFRYTYESFDGQSVLILGWGQVEFSGALSNTLQKAELNVVSRQQCSAMQDEVITNGDMCTYSDEVRDSCQSDSGGPIIWYDTSTQRYQLVGIISHGVGCASAAPGINTRVTEYLQWIIGRTNTSYCIK